MHARIRTCTHTLTHAICFHTSRLCILIIPWKLITCMHNLKGEIAQLAALSKFRVTHHVFFLLSCRPSMCSIPVQSSSNTLAGMREKVSLLFARCFSHSAYHADCNPSSPRSLPPWRRSIKFTLGALCFRHLDHKNNISMKYRFWNRALIYRVYKSSRGSTLCCFSALLPWREIILGAGLPPLESSFCPQDDISFACSIFPKSQSDN